MSLQFIFGNSGSGKSSYLYRNILKEAAEHPEKNYLVLVPEQFTMQTQRELVRLEKSHAIMNVDVLSFARLAYRNRTCACWRRPERIWCSASLQGSRRKT